MIVEKDKSKNINESPLVVCSIKNCRKRILSGKEIKVDGKIYCSVCGTIIIKTSLGL